ncbi:MAG: 3-hydroxyacyl-CoA dehydrogenase NAD-binding domain-containing protein [Rhodospirillales bacterium]|nr:3-hydroxyacyl-CoA dehydrogenase NAD-binding domain-containing protein [Rhodospirillales bacterium]MCW8860936.1 3-hydroxyacyl-CoA dehydrogenase NAD-binding domain-containing protein [Rhodospirillales bacterium]MCW8952760.1 3-hydroxyacyl-CoA dehydrogenase NAD-binding domain-containing protein [Rhodospirillales bacterium]
MSELVSYQRNGSVGVITIENPPVNALGAGVRKGLVDCLAKGNADAEAAVLVLIGGGRTFPAGADITEFGKPMAEPDLNAVITAYESSGKMVVAAIHGTALGGGLELALGCDYRCASSNANVGLPEVKLGILPGAGGTQRLPRLIGAEAALKMIVSGDMVKASDAHGTGIVDHIVDGELVVGAVAFAQSLIDEGKPRRRISDMTVTAPAELFEGFAKSIARSARGFKAPFACIESVRAAVDMAFDDGMANERRLFVECVGSPESKGQRHMFFAEREAAKIPDVPKDTPTRDIASAGIIGAGTMGGGIAMNFANAGIPVTLLEVNQEALDKGLSIIAKNYANTVKKGRLSQDAMDKRMALISGTQDYADLANADIVIEAVFEGMELKKEIFTKLDEVCKPGAILATNTSTLDVNEIAAVTKRPEDVIGTHFFSPANVMKLLEIVRAEKTAKDVVATTMKLSRTIRKVGVLVGVCDGFVGNRMLHDYFREAQCLVEEGALPQQVDRVLYDWGFAMGPFAVMDLAGIDVGWRIRKEQAATRDKNLPYPSTVADRLAEQGRFGQKTGKGWYLYEEGSRTPKPDPEVEKMILQVSGEKGISRRAISDEEIFKRCMYQLVNAGANILDEGIALRSGDIDVIYIYGYGFPVYRGGPMFHADQIGLKSVYEDVCKFKEAQGAFWKPAPLLKRLADEGKGFSDL